MDNSANIAILSESCLFIKMSGIELQKLQHAKFLESLNLTPICKLVVKSLQSKLLCILNRSVKPVSTESVKTATDSYTHLSQIVK